MKKGAQSLFFPAVAFGFLCALSACSLTIPDQIYNLTIRAGIGGSATPSGTSSVLYGKTVTVRAQPSPGYAFYRWHIDSGTYFATIREPYLSSTEVWLSGGDATIIAEFIPKVAEPKFSQTGGTYMAAQRVTLATETAGATIHYTSDGSSPDASSAVYRYPLIICAPTTLLTLKAVAVKAGMADSDVVVVHYTIVGVTQLAVGWYHTTALAADGTVWAWGWNSFGQLGDGTTGSRSSPAKSGFPTGISTIAGGGRYTVAMKTDGTVWTLGSAPELATWLLDTPAEVAGLAGASRIAAGWSHSVAVVSGTVWTWGSNTSGQLGDGTTTSRAFPAPVSGLSDVIAVAAGAGGRDFRSHRDRRRRRFHDCFERRRDGVGLGTELLRAAG